MKPILMMKDHLALRRLEKIRDKEFEAILEEVKLIEKKQSELHARYWADVYQYLDKAGIMSAKEAKKKHLTIDNGVLYERTESDKPSFESFMRNLLK